MMYCAPLDVARGTDFCRMNKPSHDERIQIALGFNDCASPYLAPVLWTRYVVTCSSRSSCSYQAFCNPSSSQACSPEDVASGEYG
uniref:Uncharacterized protein n=1 Tax=Arundo donax TaxID=35708 RepID=A0A0A8ZGY4_ARUDO